MNLGRGSACLILFIKAPVAGCVKTRLGARIGLNNARRLSMAMTMDTLETVSGLGLPCRIHYAPAGQRRSIMAWLGRKGEFLPQQGNDLGQKMSRAFGQAFAAGYERALLLGSDVPDLPLEHLKQALTILDDTEAVFNPTTDGGFCLLGLKAQAFQEALLSGLTWGHGDVLRQTAGRLQRAGLGIAHLPVWSDVDRLGDLYALGRRKPEGAKRSLRLLVKPGYGRPRGSPA